MKDDEIKRLLQLRGIIAEGDGVVAVLEEDAQYVKVILDGTFFIKKYLSLAHRMLRTR